MLELMSIKRETCMMYLKHCLLHGRPATGAHYVYCLPSEFINKLYYQYIIDRQAFKFTMQLCVTTGTAGDGVQFSNYY